MKSMRKWSDVFRCAIEGIIHSLRTERNLRIHLLAGILVMLAALFFQLPPRDIALLLVMIALVISAELLNTAIEKAVDLISPDWHELAKFAKDAAAAAVLVAAIISVIVAILLFYQPMMNLFLG
ncbi:hypothetical protein GCM10010913_00730 [Paenibacillus aceti]|uniref:Diacylglycerol kinase n=2 Tax=Paenibacillus aceti TaxID=1820010 RepID=A0ABQ1VN35_9BACL|nr:diacylglycerol kinase family protein [Paenibacillus aceti]GGF83093.1 hypothetical protein GCM10010913_00730 [Paenibacillus aceti]